MNLMFIYIYIHIYGFFTIDERKKMKIAVEWLTKYYTKIWELLSRIYKLRVTVQWIYFWVGEQYLFKGKSKYRTFEFIFSFTNNKRKKYKRTPFSCESLVVELFKMGGSRLKIIKQEMDIFEIIFFEKK